ncbi:hypothetical protein HG535_0D04880 [Zygotorulaspora mrakii]|uniref:N-alpha-acetyltransferase, 35 NatC auxiliary subunit n=1 Tax=Zygotorulaspora mrakii TaxID=42260 RepID=A0A7H9B481_ZYGMR|nr:uncharacterized protein HG535_0D04880 [Zygotorulaspora mrakii]QLG72779.1 hypothetical protein HG535_0D04880 [Zygotorulaspora mrakii]
MVLEQGLRKLHVEEQRGPQLFSDNTVTADDLIDITETLKRMRLALQPDSIIKEPSFDLFEGTHSLEVNNKKLDTSLITLSQEETEYDCNTAHGESQVEKLGFVTGIVDQLCRYLICWLNDYQLLPTTILSCRYLEYLLIESANIDDMVYLKTGDLLYDQVLCSAIYGISYFAKFVERLMKNGGVCPEEDLNFNSMGLDFLSYVCEPSKINKSLKVSLEHLSAYGDTANHLVHLLKLIECLVCMEECLTKYSAGTAHLDKLMAEALYLQNKNDSETFILPLGCFSMGIQKRLSNQSPPKSLVIPSKNYDGFIVMATDLKLILSVNEAKTVMELMQFTKFFNKATQRHVISRAVFFAFIIRHDETVLGRYTFSQFAQLHPLEFSLASTEISKKLPEEAVPVLEDITNVLFDWYQNAAQNTSRYRQGYNRQLLLWDALQVQMENIELEFESKMMADRANEPFSDDSMLPFTSWIFAMKVTAMIEFVLKGFDLDVYKPFESYVMFWYSYYLSYQLESCLEKIHKFVDSRINKIVSLNKKIKKLKAGEKKEKLRAQYRFLMDTEMAQLQTNKKFLTFLLMECTIIRSLSLSQVLQFAILKSFNVIDNKSTTKCQFTSNELLYELRMKVFSSIGVPEVVPYNMIESTLNDFMISEPMFALKLKKTMECIQKETQNASIAVDNVIKCIASDKDGEVLYSATRLVKPQATDYFQRLKTSAKAIQLNSKVINAKLENKQTKNDPKSLFTMRLKSCENASSFFPLLELVDTRRQKSKSKK